MVTLRSSRNTSFSGFNWFGQLNYEMLGRILSFLPYEDRPKFHFINRDINNVMQASPVPFTICSRRLPLKVMYVGVGGRDDNGTNDRFVLFQVNGFRYAMREPNGSTFKAVLKLYTPIWFEVSNARVDLAERSEPVLSFSFRARTSSQEDLLPRERKFIAMLADQFFHGLSEEDMKLYPSKGWLLSKLFAYGDPINPGPDDTYNIVPMINYRPARNLEEWQRFVPQAAPTWDEFVGFTQQSDFNALTEMEYNVEDLPWYGPGGVEDARDDDEDDDDDNDMQEDDGDHDNDF